MKRLFTRANPVTRGPRDERAAQRAGSAKEVRQFGFDLSHAGASYEAGDSLGIVCANTAEVVEEWLDATGLGRRAIVEVDGEERFLEDALRTQLDITRITSDLLAFVAERNRRFAPRGAPAPREQGPPRAVPVEHAGRRPAARVPGHAPTPRNGSRCSSACSRASTRSRRARKTSPHEVQLTVSVVRFETETGRRRGGVCSTFLADAAARRARVPAEVAALPPAGHPPTRP